MNRAVSRVAFLARSGVRNILAASRLLPITVVDSSIATNVIRPRRISYSATVMSNPTDKSGGQGSSSGGDGEYNSILYEVRDRVAHITLNRPHRFNAIDLYMPFELERAVEAANFDKHVKVWDLLLVYEK